MHLVGFITKKYRQQFRRSRSPSVSADTYDTFE